MPIKVAINGYGRIGRNILRALYESGRTNEIQIVAINDLGDAETNAHLTQYDTAHGRFPHEVAVDGGQLVVKGDRIKVFAERDPAKLPWASLGVDVVLECTGLFTSKAKAGAHLNAGAKKVVISAQGGSDVVAKKIGYVALNFPAGSVRAQTNAQVIGRVARGAVVLPEDVRRELTRERRAGDPDAAIDPLADPAIRDAVAKATFEQLIGFQLTQDQLRYNATR